MFQHSDILKQLNQATQDLIKENDKLIRDIDKRQQDLNWLENELKKIKRITNG